MLVEIVHSVILEHQKPPGNARWIPNLAASVTTAVQAGPAAAIPWVVAATTIIENADAFSNVIRSRYVVGHACCALLLVRRKRQILTKYPLLL